MVNTKIALSRGVISVGHARVENTAITAIAETRANRFESVINRAPSSIKINPVLLLSARSNKLVNSRVFKPKEAR